MQNWQISVSDAEHRQITQENHTFMVANDFLRNPRDIVESASLQNFAKITPQYPGVRAPLPRGVCTTWLDTLSPVLDTAFIAPRNGWRMEAWFSIVTASPNELVPMQCFPHVDGTDPDQLAMMVYLHDTPHGGTGFFRHRSTGFESLTQENFPAYRAALENDVRKTGLPPRAYVTDGAPHFERFHESEGGFNTAVFYRGNLLHSGIIAPGAELSSDPRKGRLTINAFFRPIR